MALATAIKMMAIPIPTEMTAPGIHNCRSREKKREMGTCVVAGEEGSGIVG